MPLTLDPKTSDFYRGAMARMSKAGISFLVGGAYAMERYTGIERHTKDFDVFVRPPDVDPALALFAEGGFRTEMTHPHWLGKVYHEDAFVDVIFGSGNGVVAVDEEWFEHAVPDEVLGFPVGLCPAEEILWSKSYVMERERFDGADVAHLLRACGPNLDWGRLVRRFGPDWRILLAHLVLFGFIYPAERLAIPERVMADLLARLQGELGSTSTEESACFGTLLSRSQYLIDLRSWGYADARLEPKGRMSQADIDHWTGSIERDGTF
ncbi:nucleotidyltransferase family protein [Singulisphaera rosea]